MRESVFGIGSEFGGGDEDVGAEIQSGYWGKVFGL